MSEDAVRIEWTPQEIFLQVLRLYVLQGIIRGSVYGVSFGAFCNLLFGPFGMLCIPVGVGIGLIAGTVLGLIGGCVLGGFSVWWERHHGGTMSEQLAVNRDRYRLWVNRLAVGTTMLVGFLMVAMLIGFRRDVGSWSFSDNIALMIALVPVAFAGYASSQGTRKIIDWHETQFELPFSKTIWDETVREGVWPPAPIRPQDH